MKTLIVLVMGILAGSMGCMAQTSQDTTIVVNNAYKVTIEKTQRSLAVKVEGSAENPSYFYSHQMEVDTTASVITTEKNADWDFTIPFVGKKKKSRKYFITRDITSISIGMVNAVKGSDPLNIDMGASYEVSVDNVVRAFYNLTPSTSVSIGAGVRWRNYRMTGNTRFVKEGNNLVLDNYPEGADVKFSRLKTFSISVPVMLNQAINHHVAISLGTVINANTYGSLKTRYTLGDEKMAEKSKNIHQNRTTVDFTAILRFKQIGIYAKYSPSNVLNTEFGPKFNSYSAGISLYLW